MHEMALATSLMAQLEQLAVERDLVRITAVEVTCGELKQVVPEAFELAFSAVTEGTLADGATLTLQEEALSARCSDCGCTYRPPVDNYLCPQCGSAAPQWLAGHDIILRAIEAETRDAAEDPPA